MTDKNEVTHLPYEGAGCLLVYNDRIVVGKRIKTTEALVKDPTEEVEYMGGKVEGDETPQQTAYNELVEELGVVVLKQDWLERATVKHIWQPFSKKWIWCFVVKLVNEEFAQLCKAASELSAWPADEKRNFEKFAGRKEEVRKAIDSLWTVGLDDFRAYLNGFTKNQPATDNRMKDAKKYRDTAALPCTALVDGLTEKAFPLRAFNTVLFENQFV